MQIIDRLFQLEQKSAELEPTANTRNIWDQAVMQYAHEFVDSLSERKAYDTELDKSELILNHPIGEEGIPINDILEIYKKGVDEPGLNPASGGHLGYIPGGGIYASALGDYLAAVGNRYAGIYYGSPGAVQMEHKLIEWMAGLFEFPSGSGGTLCSGGSIANLVAICAARDAHDLRPSNIEKSVIYLSAQVHHCIFKALRIAGLEYCMIRQIPLDVDDRIEIEILSQQIQSDRKEGLKPWMVVASAGTTDTGTIDPLDAIGNICKEKGIWFHIDAAYGGFFYLLDFMKSQFKGIEKADSLVIDPHKGLFLPYGLGAVLVKNKEHLLRTNYYLANYMQDAYRQEVPLSPADLSPELTRHFRALRLWLPLQLLGLKPFRAALEEKILLAKYVAKELQKITNIELRHFPQLSVVCFRINYGDGSFSNELNLKLIDFIKSDGKVFLSSTVIDGKVYLRMAILSFRTHRNTVDYALQKIQVFCDKNIEIAD